MTTAERTRSTTRTTPPTAVVADGSPIPARLRIVGWIVLATALGLLAVVLTVRSALLSDALEGAGANVVQEVDEFRTFAERGQDPATGAPPATAERLLSLYLERQFPGRSEVLLGYDESLRAATGSALVVQGLDDRFGLLGDDAAVRAITGSDALSGTGTTARGGDFVWGRAEVVSAGGAPAGFVTAEFTGPATDEVADTTRLIALVSLGGLLLTAAIAFAVAGQILAPVRSVTRAAGRITRADLSQRVEVRGRDDVAALATTVNSMLDRLQTTFEAQRRHTAAAEAHVRSVTAALVRDEGTRVSRAAAAAEVAATLDDLRILSTSLSPDFVRPAPVALGALTERLQAEVAGLDPQREWVVTEWAEGTATVDAERVSQAVRRLASNALAQPGTGPLVLGTRRDDAWTTVLVTDHGPGLTAEQAQELLERFRTDDPGTDDPGTDGTSADGGDGGTGTGGGPGLGLAVVRAVADAHQGSVWVESTPGRGATVALRLPTGPAGPPGTAPHRADGAP